MGFSLSKRVLVTGATGFIGRAAIAVLAKRGWEVHAAARSAGALPGCRFHSIDLMDRFAVQGLLRQVAPSHLLHLAWYAEPGKFWTAPENLDWVAASLFLYRAFLDAGGERALFAGSCAEYDWSYAELDEACTPTNPRTLYGCAKNALRELIESHARLVGTQIVWGRIFFLYGPGEAPNRLVSDLIRFLSDGRPVECTHGRQERDFMHVSDAARAFATVLESAHCGPVNIASGICRPIADAIGIVARLLGRPDLIRLGAREPPTNDPPRLAADVTLLSQLGFRPEYDLEAGLAQTVGLYSTERAALDRADADFIPARRSVR
jgi:nucleoside-diphosphate-sugar epimerase